MQRFYAIPDSVLAAARDAGEFGTTVADDGTNTNANSHGTVTDFAKIGAAPRQGSPSKARTGVAGHSNFGKLDKHRPQGLSHLTWEFSGRGAEHRGYRKVPEEMLQSAVESNTKQASSWIAAARVELAAGKPAAARNLIAKGCEHCPKSEDIWVESINLNNNRNAKVIAAQAIKQNPHSVRLWVETMKLENDLRSKKKSSAWH